MKGPNGPWFGRHWKMLVVAAALLIVVLSVGGLLDGIRLLRGLSQVDLDLAGAGGESTNYLLVGSDSRAFVETRRDLEQFGAPNEVTGERADMIIVLHIPEGGGAPTVLSIPRDLLVNVPGQGDRRLALTFEEGPQGMVDALCNSLGIGIDHFVGIGFDGFRRLVDEVDGVDVYVPNPLRDSMTGLDLAVGGQQHLDGEAALALVRSRSAQELVDGDWRPVPDGATARERNGELVLQALGARVGDTSNPLEVRSVADVLSDELTTDVGLGLSEMRQLKNVLGSLDEESVVIQRLPAATLDGPVPVARLEPEATEVLLAAGAGSSTACPTVPRVPAVP